MTSTWSFVRGCEKVTDGLFEGEEAVLHVIERIVAPLGLRVDESSPWVDARLSDGSRVQTQFLSTSFQTPARDPPSCHARGILAGSRGNRSDLSAFEIAWSTAGSRPRSAKGLRAGSRRGRPARHNSAEQHSRTLGHRSVASIDSFTEFCRDGGDTGSNPVR
jgi:hypothetical protein